MSLIVSPTKELNAIYMGAINETAYDGEFAWINMTEYDGDEYIADMVDITIAGTKIIMPEPKDGFKYNRAAF